RDITAKQITLRTAKGIGLVLCTKETLELIKSDQLPKGNLFDVARAAAFLAAKNTQHLIPHCHPVSIDGLTISFQYLSPESDYEDIDNYYQNKHGVVIYVEGKSIGRTGIEMEVLTAVSIAALTIYDLLKPLGKKEVEIAQIKLLDKTGGKSDKAKYSKRPHSCAVLVCSESTAEGKRQD